MVSLIAELRGFQPGTTTALLLIMQTTPTTDEIYAELNRPMTTEEARLVFNEPRASRFSICQSLSDAGMAIICQFYTSTLFSEEAALFDDECLSAIELLDLTLGDWEPEAYEGWTSI